MGVGEAGVDARDEVSLSSTAGCAVGAGGDVGVGSIDSSGVVAVGRVAGCGAGCEQGGVSIFRPSWSRGARGSPVFVEIGVSDAPGHLWASR